ncbi:MAG TPA: hypothetical protein VFS44_07075, partial [Gemmatimonadaceae bacterium]|nr:hypothetical protein [Gemmatimonadaceae bacterium]
GEGTVVTRQLPGEASLAVEPLLDWLECNAAPDAGGRIYTWFNYGSYLAWRLPGYSESIDGRTIFPDSVARVEAYTSGWLAPKTYHTWSSADVAIVPRGFGVAATIDASPDWHLVAWSWADPKHEERVGLWVRRAWWTRMGETPLPARPHLQLASLHGAGPACARRPRAALAATEGQ